LRERTTDRQPEGSCTHVSQQERENENENEREREREREGEREGERREEEKENGICLLTTRATTP